MLSKLSYIFCRACWFKLSEVDALSKSGTELFSKVFSKNKLNLFWAWPRFISIKPRINDPAKPSNELLNAILIPWSGAFKPSFKELKKPATFVSSIPSPLITLPTEPIVLSKPQNVPSRPRNTNSPTKYLDVSLTLESDISVFSINLFITELLKTNLPSICFKSLEIFFRLPLLLIYDFGDDEVPQPSAYTLARTGNIAEYGLAESSYGGAIYGSTGSSLIRQSVEGGGFTVATKILDATTNNPVALKGFEMEFTPGGRR